MFNLIIKKDEGDDDDEDEDDMPRGFKCPMYKAN